MKFLQLPMFLFEDECAELSSDCKILYAFMLDRMSLSKINADKFTDKDGKLYIIYTVEQVMSSMRCSEPYAVKMLKQLEDFGLIRKRRQGQGKPSIIYVKYLSTGECNLSTDSMSELNNIKFKNLTPLSSKTKRNEVQELNAVKCSHTNSNQTNRSQTNNKINGEKSENSKNDEYNAAITDAILRDIADWQNSKNK